MFLGRLRILIPPWFKGGTVGQRKSITFIEKMVVI